MSQRREQEAILLQEQAVEEKQELLAKEQAANPSEPSPVSYFYNADYDNISTPSTTYTIHLTKSDTIITNPSELTRQFNFKNSDGIIESFSPSPIPVEDSDSFMEEIDLFLTPDDTMPLGIENDDYESERDILFLEELLSNDSPSLPKNESFYFDVPSSPRPPAKPPDDDDVYFDIEPDMGVFTKVVDDISDNSTRELYVHVPNVLTTLLTLSPMFDTLLLFSSENEDKVFKHGILASNLLSHRGFKAFQVSDIH
ncbi:hypothetical protein Tco_1346243 [Tanacetum coccineum]